MPSQRSVGRPITGVLRQAAGSAFARDAGLLTLGQAIGMALAVLQTALIARRLGVEDFGVLTLVMALPALVHGLVDARSEEAVVRFVVRYRERGDVRRALAVLSLAIVVDVAAIAVAGLGLLGVHVLGGSTDAGRDTAWFLTVGLIVSGLTSLQATARSTLVAVRAFAMAAVSDVIGSMIRLGAVAVVTASAHPSVGGVLVALAIASVAHLAVLSGLAVAQLRRVGLVGRLPRPVRALGSDTSELVRFIALTDGTASLSTVVREGDVLVVGALAGQPAAGAYRLARSLVAPLGAVVSSLQAALFPRLAASVEDLARFIRPRSALVVGGAAVGALTGLVALVAAPWAVSLIGGDEFDAAVGPARWLLAGGAGVLALHWVRPALLASGQTRYLLINSTVVAALSVAAFYVGAELAGAAGVAAGRTLVTSIGGSAIAGAYVLRRSSHLADEEARHPVGALAADESSGELLDEPW